MTMADLANYRPVKREAVCGLYRAYLLCAPPPPASGVGLIELMELLERTDIAARGPNDPQSWFLFAEASRLMYADRDRYVGDPGVRARAGRGPARSRLSRAARAADRRNRRSAACRRHPSRRPRRRRGPHAGADRHLAFHRPRRRRQRRLHDDHGREHLRHRPDGRRLLPQQPADRFLVLAGRTRRAVPSPTPSRRASARARR